jgi:hypothetical protein
VPLVVRFPPRFQPLAPAMPGGVSDRLVSFVDFGPTLLSLAGVAIPIHMHGVPFLGAGAGPPRQYVFGFRDRMDERYDLQRAVRDSRYKYIRNYLPHLPYAQHIAYMYEMPTMRAWQRLHDEGKLAGPQRLFFQAKPVEELYDIAADPHEIHNLAGEVEHRAVLESMRAALRSWITETRDTGFLPEAEIHARAQGTTAYEMARDTARYPLDRILDAAELASRREAANLPRLVEFLGDTDSAVRAWGATGLRTLGKAGEPGRDALRRALDDLSPSVRVAAAAALADLGDREAPLRVLTASLKDASEWVRLEAAIALDGLDDRARDALPAIRETMAAEKNDYVRWALTKLLRDLKES